MSTRDPLWDPAVYMYKYGLLAYVANMCNCRFWLTGPRCLLGSHVC
jgi:hypothetical protein